MGCKLSLSDINMEGVQETKQILIKKGVPSANIHVMHIDVSKRASISECAKSAKEAFGTVTMLINNAGIVSGHQTLQLSDAMIERTMHVNTISHMHTIREFLPDMIANKKGHVVSIASMAGLAGIPGLPDYCASKWGAVAVDESLRLELKKNGHYGYIKTTCICPYFIDTGMFAGAKNAFPMYILSPEEVVTRIVNAIRQEEAMVTIPYRGNVVYLVKLLPTSWVDKIGGILGLAN
jgi:all-trans-retinol dehydrogenase (NAD+)